jgi:hypothetical protein
MVKETTVYRNLKEKALSGQLVLEDAMELRQPT